MTKRKRRRICASCDRVLRKGSSRRAWVMTPHRELVSGLVCSRCALRAIAFVVPPATTMAPPCTQCKRAPASVCAGCHERVCRAVSDTTKANLLLKLRRALGN